MTAEAPPPTDLRRRLLVVLGHVDVRLVLGLLAAVLFLAAGQPARFVVLFAKEMTNERTVVPICCAMGFAHVLKLTGCDRHLVHLLLRPLRRVGPLLLPGGIVVAFLVNTAIVSQSSVAATVGVVLVPLLLGARLQAVTAGAALLLGASVGGEQMNPGAVEIVTLASLTGLEPAQAAARVLPYNLVAAGVAILCFTWQARGWPRLPGGDEGAALGQAPPRLNFLGALVPVVPLLILFAVPRAYFFSNGHEGAVRIAAAMLLGVTLAGIATPSAVSHLGAAFFQGAGYAYTHVISLIVTATVFTEAIKALGVIEALARALGSRPLLLLGAAVLLPGALAALTGSGIAPAVAVMKVLLPLSARGGVDPVRLGALISVSAQLGRTMSPAAAVVAMAATISGAPPLALLRRVVVPILCGAAALLLMGMLYR